MPIHIAKTASPLGEILLAATDAGIVGIWFMEEQKHFPHQFDGKLGSAPLLSAEGELVSSKASATPKTVEALSPYFPWAAKELAAFFAGTLRQFSFPLAPMGTPFQEEVWAALRAIPYGTTCSYSHIATAMRRPRSARPVGGAVGHNPIGIVIPCHRVVGNDGSLTGYAGGLHRKKFLLNLEKQTLGQREAS